MAALAHGMPIISTQPRVSIPAIVDGENMVLVAAEDEEALASRIRELAASREQRSRLARGAAELARRFSWAAIAERTLALYERTLGARS